MSIVRRWTITDPYDTNPATNHYLFPRNPAEMTSLYPERPVSSMTTTAGRILLYEGRTTAKQWQFSGMVLDKLQLDALNLWVYTKRRRLVLNDHFGRNISLVFTALEATPKRRVNFYYSHDYTVSALVLSISAPTMPDNHGPLV